MESHFEKDWRDANQIAAMQTIEWKEHSSLTFQNLDTVSFSRAN